MSYKFFQNDLCEFMPCHRFPHKDFNCIWCYCVLYPYENCGGNYSMLGANVKDCSECILPHKPENYDYIITKLIELQNGGK